MIIRIIESVLIILLVSNSFLFGKDFGEKTFHKDLFLNFEKKSFSSDKLHSLLSISNKEFESITADQFRLKNSSLSKDQSILDSKTTFSNQFISDTLDQNLYEFKIKELQKIQYQIPSIEQKKISLPKLFFVTALTGVSIAVVHKHQSQAWWQEKRTRFHFQNDWEYALWIDKLGHWWGATALQHLFSSSLRWSNFSYETSNILGSLFALSYQLYVETYDGFAPNWGFSPGDALFDFGGAVYPLVQYYSPFFKNINLKLSYYPSKRLLKKDPLDTLYKNKFVIDDYEGQSFYLSFKVNNFLPESIEKYWPDFLCLAIGYQMRNWNGYGVADENYYFVLDFDFEQIPLYGQFWQFLKNTFNLIHFPSPAIKFSKNKISFAIAY